MDVENNVYEQQETRAYAKTVSQTNESERALFIRKTYGHLALALLGFVVVEYIFINTPAIWQLAMKLTQGWMWLIMLGGFMFITNLANKWAHTSVDRNKQYAALALYVVAEAFIFVPLIYIALNIIPAGSQLLMKAFVLTAFLFSGISAIAFGTKRDFSWLGKVLTIGGFIAMGLIVAGIAFGFDLGLFFSFAMVGLAGGSILYQTSNIVHHYRTDQYVAAALGLFASFMLLLWYVLDILMRLQGD